MLNVLEDVGLSMCIIDRLEDHDCSNIHTICLTVFLKFWT
jgi:hypothetical protein